jgi:hypothetical protein
MTTRHPIGRRPRAALTRRSRVRSAAVVATACACAVLAGCGSGSGATAAGGTTGSTSSAEPSSSAPSASTAPAEGASAQGSSAPAPTPPAATTAPTTAPGGGTPAGPGRCTTGQLDAELRDPGEGAGQRFVTVVLTNVGAGSCLVEGYGGVGLVDGSGGALPTQQVRDSAVRPEAVVLAPGASAVSRLQWTVVPGTGDATDGPCQPTPTDLQVIPPDERAPLSVAWPYGPVCAGGRIDQQGYRAG